MPAGILQLLLSGAQDKILTSNPQINHFKIVYLKHSNFSIFNYEIPITSQLDFNSLINFEIPKNGDLLRGIQLKIELPSVSIKYNNSLDVEIQNIKNTNSYKSIDKSIYDYNLYNLNTLSGIMNYELNNVKSYPNFELYWYDSNTKKETYSVIIPKIDLNEFITESDQEYYFEINPNKLIFSNSSINFSYPLISTPLINTDYISFYNKLLKFSNRNNKLIATFSVIDNLSKKSDKTTLLTSDNMKNIFKKNIKDNLFLDDLIASLDSLYKYVNSIRFIRPINLYDQTSIQNILSGADTDLLGYPEYNETYFLTSNLKLVNIAATVLNTDLNVLTSRLIYVLNNTGTENDTIITFNGNKYYLYNILLFNFINYSVFSTDYNSLLITSSQFVNLTDPIKSYYFILNFNFIANQIFIQITPFGDNYSNELNSFTGLIQVFSAIRQLNNEYKIEIRLRDYTYNFNLIGKFIYFYLGQQNISPFCILKITSYYLFDSFIYIFATPIIFSGLDFNINQKYLIDNQYLIQKQTSNSLNLQEIEVSNINIDVYNLYQNYLNIPSNVNFNLDGTLETEESQKAQYITNFSNYILDNINNNFDILYNIFNTLFKNPSDYISSATNLYYDVSLLYNSTIGYTMSGLGISTFTEQDTTGNSLMIKYLYGGLSVNFSGLTITNNYYLSIISTNIDNYFAAYQQNWYNTNNILQKAPYIKILLSLINFINNTPLYINIKLNNNSLNNNLPSSNTSVNIYSPNTNVPISSIILSRKNCFIESGNNHLHIFITDYNISDISNVCLLSNDYTLQFDSYSAKILDTQYVQNVYNTEYNSFLSRNTILNPTNSIYGNYIYVDYILNLYNYIANIYQKYITYKYKTSSNMLSYVNENILYKYMSSGYQIFLNLIINRLVYMISLKPSKTSTNISFLSDFYYLTDTNKINNYFYNTIISNFYDNIITTGYYYINSFSVESHILKIKKMINTHSSFSSFINYTIDSDTNSFKNSNGQLLKTYIYYNYALQLKCKYNRDNGAILYPLETKGIRNSKFNALNAYNTFIYEPEISYDISNVESNVFNNLRLTPYKRNYTYVNSDYRFKMNPHLYYSYLNLGYVENLLSLYRYGNINLQIKNYTDFKYSDIDNVIVNVLDFYNGISLDSKSNLLITMNPTTSFYSNVILNTSITNILLNKANIITNTNLNDLIYYSTNRDISTGVSLDLINFCNIFVEDVKSLICYFNDYLDNLQYIRYITLNDTTISNVSLSTKLNIPNYKYLDTSQINDYNLEYYSSDVFFNSVNNYRSTYIYNSILVGFDNDITNYYNYFISNYNFSKIGSSLKQTADRLSYSFPQDYINNFNLTSKLYGNIDIQNLPSIKTSLSSSKVIFNNNYNYYLNNRALLDLNDNIELNTINDTIKNLNLQSGNYIPTLSSIDQFIQYNRQLFGYNIDKLEDFIYDTSASITHTFSTSNVSNIVIFNNALLYCNSYKFFAQTYEYQLRRIKSYFNTDVKNIDESDLNYLKPLYALENTDIYYYTPILISQINKLYNYDIPSDIVSNLSKLNKLDNNFNQLYYNINRNVNNAYYYSRTLKILEFTLNNGMGILNQSDLSFMLNFLNNSVIYQGYKINSENGYRYYTNKDPYSLIDYGTISFFSLTFEIFLIPIINRYSYKLIDLSLLTTNDLITVFYYNFLYLLHDLYLLDGKMRVKYSDISSINSKFFNSTNYITTYKNLVAEYFYLILRGKEIVEETGINIITYSKIHYLVNNSGLGLYLTYSILPVESNYDRLFEYLLYSNFSSDNSYDLYYSNSDYNIINIKNNHKFSENFAIIYSIKNSINDINFEHLINLTNYNNKYLQFYDNNSNISNITLLQQLYLENLNITNDYKFFQNIVVTNEDYNKISSSNIFNPSFNSTTYKVDSINGNIILDINDISNLKVTVINYFLNELYNSNTIINTHKLNDSKNKSVQSITIDNLQFKNDKISEINIDLSNKQFNIQKYYEQSNSFSPLNITSLDCWFDSSDKNYIYKDKFGLIHVTNNNDRVGKWKNKAQTGEKHQLIQSNLTLQPTWNDTGSINFNGRSYFNSIVSLNTSSTLFLVTDTSVAGGYNMYFNNGNLYSESNIQGPTIWSDGPYGNYIYDDYTFNLEVDYGRNQKGINIFSFDRIDGNYVSGYNNGYLSFNDSIKTLGNTGNVTMNILPGYLDEKIKLSESMTGNIYEILIFNSVLSAQDKFNINLYLGNKWGIKNKVNYENNAEYYTFDFDYLPKLYNYNLLNGNILITNHSYDQKFSNIYETIYTEYKNISNDINYKISRNLDIQTISGYLYFTDFMNDLKSIVIKHSFEYDLSVSDLTYSVNNSNIYISNTVINNYNNYISDIENYKQDISIKDSFELILNPLQFDTNYTRYNLMNYNVNSNSNIITYFDKLPNLIEKTDTISLNNNERFYQFNELISILYLTAINGSINYRQLSLPNTYIGNVILPTTPYPVNYNTTSFYYINYQNNNNSNIILLNDVIDVNNKLNNLYDEKVKILNNTISKINQVNNEILNYNNTNNEIEIIKKRPPTAILSWIEKLGYYIADYFELYIGGELIERIEDNFMNCFWELYIDPEMKRAQEKMIGQDSRLILKQSKKGTYLLYIDIPFFFNRNKKMNGLAIPLIGLLYNKLNLKFKTKLLSDLIDCDPYTKISQNSKLKMNLMLDYILLDHSERKKFAESKHEYIIEQVQYSNYIGSSLSITNQIKLNFKNPTKMMIWYVQLKDKIKKKQYYNYTADDYYINIKKYIDKTEINNPYLKYLANKLKYLIEDLLKRDPNNTVYNQLSILRMPFENHNRSLKGELQNAVEPSSSPLIKKSNLKVNGHTRFLASSDETQLIRPYTFFNNSDMKGINVYNFNLYPLTTQPSGSINFTFLNDINLLLDFNNIIDQEFSVKTMTISYNMLRIMSGYGGLAFDVI